MKNNLLSSDLKRYDSKKNLPSFQKYYRKAQSSKCFFTRFLYRIIFALKKRKNLIELNYKTKIGEGLYIGHPYCITINSEAIIGKNCNIHKGVTIGMENRGKRKGTPIIGDKVWIGINTTIVGKINIGDDVLIAPNTFVNQDIPSHSVVFGNPCIIKHKDDATKDYINRIVD